MLKPIIRNCLVLILVAVFPVFADEPLSPFNKQGEVDYPAPFGKDEYLAKKAPPENRMSGYFGVDFGPNISYFNTHAAVNNRSGSLSKAIINYGITGFGGYGGNLGHLYLGSELSLYYNFLDNWVNSSIKDASGKTTDVSVNVQQPLAVGLDFIPGYLTDSRNFLLYGRLGVGVNWTKLRFTDNTNVIPGGARPSDKSNAFVFGLRAGAGVEYFVCTNFGMRLEYTYVGYNKVSGDPYTSSTNNTYSYRLDGVGSHQVKLGLLVHF